MDRNSASDLHDEAARLDSLLSSTERALDERESAAQESSEGRVLGGRYRVGAMIGCGGMGAVYKATDETTGRVVAIKCLKKSLRDEDDVSKRLLREARAVSAIGHPGTVKVLDVGHDEDGRLFLVFEYLEGRDVDSWLSTPHLLTLGDVWQLGVGALDALEAAHQVDIVHRDIKPGNLFACDEGGGRFRVKVLDFGIAKRSDMTAETKLTKTGIVVGTPQYMSPEQARGRTLDGRTDVWSLGCVLFRLLAGRVPFDDDNYADMMARMIMEDPPRLGEMMPALPAPLCKAVDGALQREQAQRFKSAADMCDVLLDGISLKDFYEGKRPSWATQRLPEPLAPSQMRRISRPVIQTAASAPTEQIAIIKPLPWKLWGAALLIALLAGGGAYFGVRWARADPPAAITPERMDEPAPPGAQTAPALPIGVAPPAAALDDVALEGTEDPALDDAAEDPALEGATEDPAGALEPDVPTAMSTRMSASAMSAASMSAAAMSAASMTPRMTSMDSPTPMRGTYDIARTY